MRVVHFLTNSSLISSWGAAPYLEQVRQQALELPFRAEVNINVTNMAERMCKADLAIGAAGGTAWERCCLGLPTVLLILADNQASGARGLERCGAVSIIERCEEIARDLPKLLKNCRNLRISVKWPRDPLV